jgi:hypothetical protein
MFNARSTHCNQAKRWLRYPTGILRFSICSWQTIHLSMATTLMRPAQLFAYHQLHIALLTLAQAQTWSRAHFTRYALAIASIRFPMGTVH